MLAPQKTGGQPKHVIRVRTVAVQSNHEQGVVIKIRWNLKHIPAFQVRAERVPFDGWLRHGIHIIIPSESADRGHRALVRPLWLIGRPATQSNSPPGVCSNKHSTLFRYPFL